MPPRLSLADVGRQNIVYSEAEQIFIKNALKTTKAGLLRLGTLRSNKTARRRQLNDQIRRYKFALAPYKKIPNEIWLDIFELYCQFGRLSTCITRQSPVVLTQVCSAWRQIALSMPRLWSDVYMGESVDLAEMWLGRAGNIPRALETTRAPPHCFDSNRFRKIQSFICSFPFKKLHLTECDAEDIDFTRIPVESLLPLEDLALLKSGTCSSGDVTHTSFSPHLFPDLVSLQIDTNTMPCFHVSSPFATWKKLRVLRLECKLARGTCFQILRDASSVEDCSLRVRDPRPHNYGQGSTNPKTIKNAVVANLKIFRLTFSYTPSLWSFLDHLTFPNLHTLILVARKFADFEPYDMSHLLPLVQRIEALRSLKLNLFYVDVDIGRVLECLPLLQVLEARCTKLTTHTAEKIGRGELGGGLRELHDCGFHNLYEFLQACELRRDVTQSQCSNSSGAISSLEKVSVRSSEREATDCKWRIRKLRKVGVEFKVFPPD